MSAATSRSATSSGADCWPPPAVAQRLGLAGGPGVASNGGSGAAVSKGLGEKSTATPSPRRSLSSASSLGRRRRVEATGDNVDASDTETEVDEELFAALNATGRGDVGAIETGGTRRSPGAALSEDDVPLSTFRASKMRKARANANANAAGVEPQPRRPARNRDNGEQDEAGQAMGSTEREMLELETRRLEFEVTQWKQQQALRRETLELKSEEIRSKEELTRQQHEVQTMEVRARVLHALGEAGKTTVQTHEYLSLLEH